MIPEKESVIKKPWFANAVEQRDTASLLPYARNARRHSDQQITAIAASIHEFGFINPLLIGSDDVVVAGHGRLAAAQKLGLESVPVIVLDHLDKTQRRALVIADNRLAELASWDQEMLDLELSGLRDVDFDVSLTGFDGPTEPVPAADMILRDSKLSVVVECDDEATQAKLIDEMEERGYTCRALML